MKVLWFSVTPSLFSGETNKHNGGGWIASLERIVSSRSDINLGIAFTYNKATVSKKNKERKWGYLLSYVHKTYIS